MPLTSVTQDASELTLTVVGDYAVPQERLWDAFADPRQLERFWGPPAWPATLPRPRSWRTMRGCSNSGARWLRTPAVIAGR